MRRTILFLIGFAAAASMAQAGQLQLTIHDGRVWLRAQDVTPRDILSEWERVGRTRIVNGDRLTGSPVSLELSGVSEQQALDVVLRSASGFMAVQRTAATAEASKFEKILILPTSVPPADSARTQPASGAPTFAAPTALPHVVYSGGVQRLVGADGQPVPDDQAGAPVMVPQPQQAPFGAVPPPMPPAPNYQPPGQPGAPAPGTQPAQPTSSPVPTAPQGVAVPGMVPAPTPGQPQQPGQIQPGPPQPVRR